jgi:hypothetical protein
MARPFSKKCNNAGDRIPVRPKGAYQMIQSIFAAFEKDSPLPAGYALT